MTGLKIQMLGGTLVFMNTMLAASGHGSWDAAVSGTCGLFLVVVGMLVG